MSTVDQRDEAKHDLVLADLEKRLEEIRQLKTYEGWRLAFEGLTAGAAIMTRRRHRRAPRPLCKVTDIERVEAAIHRAAQHGLPLALAASRRRVITMGWTVQLIAI